MREALSVVLAILVAAGPLLHARPVRAQVNPFPPAPLLDEGSIPEASSAQAASLRNFQQQAVANTLLAHGLPASDAVAAQTWGRDDALLQLWALILAAIGKPTCAAGQTPGDGCRTVDQQNVVDWLSTVAQNEAVISAQLAGLQYVKWAGLGAQAYLDLLETTPDEAQLTAFLQQGFTAARNYAAPVAECPPNTTCRTFGGVTYSEGYCVFQPPSPFESEYSDRSNQDCFTPCTNIGGCKPFGPTYDQLVKWGAAEANNRLFETSGYADLAKRVAIGAGFAIGAAAVVTALSLVGIALPAAPVAAGAAATALFPFAATIGVTIAGVASLVLFAVVAAVVAAIYAVELFESAEVPGQLARFIVGAPGTPLDLPAMLNDPEKLGGLFGLFLRAATPVPILDTCGSRDPDTGAPCLNAPPIPAPSPQSDPVFEVRVNSGTAGAPVLGPATASSTITWKDASDGSITTSRLAGKWFVNTVTTSGGETTTVQSLRMHYTDWSGVGHTAWLTQFADQGFKFLSVVDHGTSGTQPTIADCLDDGTCRYADTIEYVGPDDELYVASVLPPPLPTVTVNWSTNPVVVGSPVQFHAIATSPVGATIVGYKWQFEEKSPGPVCLPPPCLSDPVFDPDPQYTFPTSGSFQGFLTVTDSAGRSASTTFTVPVENVPPELTLAPACDPGGLVPCFPPFNDVEVALGSETRVSGSIAHAGSQDFHQIVIDWGDGSPEEIAGTTNLVCPIVNNNAHVCSPNIVVTPGFPVHFTATHTYASPGTYTVVVRVVDQAGDSDTESIAETVLPPAAAVFRPDATIDGVGDDVQHGAGVKVQKVRARIAPGATRTFTITIENDGDAVDDYVVWGAKSRGPFVVEYLDGASGDVAITDAVRAGTHRLEDVQPGESRTIRMRITSAATGPAVVRKAFRLRVTSASAPSAMDLVKAVAIRR